MGKDFIINTAQCGVDNIGFHKNGSGIHIKKKNRGKFTEYCGGEVTDECIQRAKKSKNPTLRKRATFAANSRRWSKKQLGGALMKYEGFNGHFEYKKGSKINKPNGHRSILDNE